MAKNEKEEKIKVPGSFFPLLHFLVIFWKKTPCQKKIYEADAINNRIFTLTYQNALNGLFSFVSLLLSLKIDDVS